MRRKSRLVYSVAGANFPGWIFTSRPQPGSATHGKAVGRRSRRATSGDFAKNRVADLPRLVLNWIQRVLAAVHAIRLLLQLRVICKYSRRRVFRAHLGNAGKRQSFKLIEG